jgi:iron complex outermembrane receptor protein
LRYITPGFSVAAATVATQIGALTPGDLGILGALLTTGAPPAGATPAQLAAFFADVNKGRSALASYICPVGSQCRNVYYPTAAQLASFGLAGSVPITPDLTVDLSTLSVNGTYTFNSHLYLKSITAIQTTKRSADSSTSASPFLLIDGIGDEQRPQQVTQELQLGGSALDNALTYVGGYYFFNLRGYDNGVNDELVPFQPNPVSNLSYLGDTSNSAYGQVTYALTSQLNATVGARYTSEKTSLTLGNRNAVACDVPGVPATAVGAACSNVFDNSYDKVSYTAGLDWQVLDHLLLYAKTSTGFRAGGTNQRSNPALDYAPETVTDYEIGAKSEWLDRRLRVNLAAYHSNYKDIQRSIFVEEASSFVTEIQNAASAKINGVELEVTARPLRALTLSASAAYTAPKYNVYNGFSSTGAVIDLSNNSFPNVSRWQGDVSANYAMLDRLGEFNANVDYGFRSKVDYQPDGHDANSAGYVIQDAYGLLNARVSQKVTAWKVNFGIWGKNLTNRQYNAGANDFSTSLGFAYTIPGLPRTFGVDARVSF